ncbi:MAG: hypothetical protein EZS28_017246 [Streblomastix strix]|uniref:Uncharacterized protein n=1 Tax=Streblomastix strix TaxID=222440 RepID=A0A5J4VX72_9EUKA|nr:MAG: hypothetical protein EZS28_017246 [Streblomastix strix]
MADIVRQTLPNIHSPISTGQKPGNDDIINEIRTSLGQIKDREKDLAFMKRLLHLIIIAYTSHQDEMNEIVKSTPLVDQLLHILKNMNATEENEQVIITAVLCSVGALDRLKQMVFLAQREGHTCGGDFIIWGDVNIKKEDQQQTNEKTKQIVIQKKQKNVAEFKSMQKSEAIFDERWTKDKQNLIALQKKMQQDINDPKDRLNEDLNQKDQEGNLYGEQTGIPSDLNDEDKRMHQLNDEIQTKVNKSNELSKDINTKESEKKNLSSQNKKLKKEIDGIKQASMINEIIYQENDSKKEKNESKDKPRGRSSTGRESSDDNKENNKILEKEKEKQKEQQKKQIEKKEKETPKLGEKEKMKQKESQIQKEKEKEKEEIIVETVPLRIKLKKFVFEKGIYRISNQYMNSQNSRRFGFIAEGDEIYGNIPIAGKTFRAMTYDEKGGIIRLGWTQQFRWIPTKEEHRMTFELDLRDDIPCNTIRIFYETQEGPTIFRNVPKRVKIYQAYDSNPETKYETDIFQIPNPTDEKQGEYEKVIDYNQDLTKQN